MQETQTSKYLWVHTHTHTQLTHAQLNTAPPHLGVGGAVVPDQKENEADAKITEDGGGADRRQDGGVRTGVLDRGNQLAAEEHGGGREAHPDQVSVVHHLRGLAVQVAFEKAKAWKPFFFHF
jgi:hypothetical protein